MQWPTVVIAEEGPTQPQADVSAGQLLPCFASGRITKSSELWSDGVNRWCTMMEVIAATPALHSIFGDGTMHSRDIIGYARALYTYEPREDTQTTDCAFNTGDILVILKEGAGGWLTGYVGGFANGGLNIGSRPPTALSIPGNYVQPISPFKRR
jgi:hypothetical protein